MQRRSLEHALAVPGLLDSSHVLKEQTASRVWLPVPHSSEHADHSDTSHGEATSSNGAQLPPSQYSA